MGQRGTSRLQRGWNCAGDMQGLTEAAASQEAAGRLGCFDPQFQKWQAQCHEKAAAVRGPPRAYHGRILCVSTAPGLAGDTNVNTHGRPCKS
eukprot:6491642-Amphidinium_carterae.11